MAKRKQPGGRRGSSGSQSERPSKARSPERGAKRSHSERPQPGRAPFERPQTERPQSERPQAHRPRETREPHKAPPARSSRPGPQAERSRFERTQAQPARAQTERPHIKRQQSEHSASPRSHAELPKPARPQVERPQLAPPAPEPAREGVAAPSRRSSEIWIYGHHPVAAVLSNPDRKILRVVATTEAAAKLGEEASIPPRIFGHLKGASRREIDDLVGGGAVHQGVAVLTHALDHDLVDALVRISANPESCIIVLDQVTDPHNVGAILRSAAAFGAGAVVAPDRHAPDESGVMAKSASGALDEIPYIKAGNLVRALELIKGHQFWLVGLDAEAPQQLSEIKLGGRIALVLGAEGEGLRRLVRETCDHVAYLPMAGNMESLNVSNAAAVALYERARQTTPARGDLKS